MKRGCLLRVSLKPKMKLYLVAIEPSADELGAELAKNLKAQSSDITLAGIGGAAMRAEGLPSQMEIEGLAIVGITEALLKIHTIWDKLSDACERIIESKADAVVMIDSYGFMIRLARKLKKAGYQGRLIKYVAPQVWAMRPSRTKRMAKYFDALLAIHEFEPDWFTKDGLESHYVGNAVFDTDYRAGDPQRLREQYKLGERPVLAVFLGSRMGEIVRLSKPFTDAVQNLKTHMPDLVIICPVSDSVAKEVGAQAGADPRMNDMILLPESAKLDAMACATAALACSGTVTTQLASAAVPTIVAYRMSPVTFVIVRHLFQPDYISIVNIAADEALMPEFVQSDVTGEGLAKALLPYLTDTKKRADTSDALLQQTARMRGALDETASARAARTILSILA